MISPIPFQDFHRVIINQCLQTHSLSFGLVIFGHRVKDLQTPDLGLDVDLPICRLNSQGLVYLLDSFTVPSLFHKADGLVSVDDTLDGLCLTFLIVALRDQIVENE